MYEEILNILGKGGFVVLPIFLVAQIGWFFVVERFFFLRKMACSQDEFWKSIPKDKNTFGAWKAGELKVPGGIFGNIISKIFNMNEPDGKSMSFTAREVLEEKTAAMHRHLSTISVMATSAPLLGLLGTVSGMITTFRVIMQYGIGNPAMMAEGISEALLTTQAGLIAGFPLLLMHNYLFNKAEEIESGCISGTARLINVMG